MSETRKVSREHFTEVERKPITSSAKYRMRFPSSWRRPFPRPSLPVLFPALYPVLHFAVMSPGIKGHRNFPHYSS